MCKKAGRLNFPAYFLPLAKGRIKSYSTGMSKLKVSLTVPPEYIAQVDQIAVRRKSSRSYIVTEAIEKYLHQVEANGHKPTTQPSTQKKAGTR